MTGMVFCVGLAGSSLVGAALLFLCSVFGVPPVFGTMAIATALPLLLRMEKVVPRMGLASAARLPRSGLPPVTGNFMSVSRLVPPAGGHRVEPLLVSPPERAKCGDR